LIFTRSEKKKNLSFSGRSSRIVGLSREGGGTWEKLDDPIAGRKKKERASKAAMVEKKAKRDLHSSTKKKEGEKRAGFSTHGRRKKTH